MTVSLKTLPDSVLNRLHELHGELSPEALTADGEISESEWAPRKRLLDAELLQIQASHGLNQDDVDEFAVMREVGHRREASRRSRAPRMR
ncbi:hypothetical protein ABIC83_002589 [Roseateles asaccharophilus]|uniref:hypothetical protein n=1 Tax=Roseateles asaccharophilus TaxID=582607 RepID=UPI003836BA02